MTSLVQNLASVNFGKIYPSQSCKYTGFQKSLSCWIKNAHYSLWKTWMSITRFPWGRNNPKEKWKYGWAGKKLLLLFSDCSAIVSLQIWLQILFRCPQNWLLHYYRTNTEHVKNPYIFEKLPGNYLQFLLYVCKPCMWCKVKITILNMVNWKKMEKYELLTTFYTRGMICMCIDVLGENSVLFRKITATWSINSMNFSFFRMCFTLLYTGYQKMWKLFQK